jgi:hypothetical protein
MTAEQKQWNIDREELLADRADFERAKAKYAETSDESLIPDLIRRSKVLMLQTAILRERRNIITGKSKVN